MFATDGRKHRFNRHVLGWLICAGVVAFSGAVVHSAEGSGDGFRKLTGPEIQRVFVDLDLISYPGLGGSRYTWSISFGAKGNWEGQFLQRAYIAHGTSHIENDEQCIEIVWNDSQYGESPFEGCFSVYANPESGELAAKHPNFGPKLVIMTTTAYSEIARVMRPEPAPQIAVHSSQRLLSAEAQRARDRQKLERQKREQAATEDRQKIDAEKRELEYLRLALEKERLQQQRAELQNRRTASLQQQPQREPDRAAPVIVTSTALKTNRQHVTISGSVSDESGVAAVQVDGKAVPFDAADGRFSVKADVAIGRSTIRVAALDVRGNWAETLVSVERKRRIPEIDFGRYHALIIGIDDYQKLPKLKTAIGDATAVAETLRELYGYEVITLINATRTDILDAFDELRETLGKNDNLLVYYAGHGWLDEKSGRGYWLPVNARADRRARWFSNADLTDSLKVLDAKHVMVVADSCYAGTLTRSIKVPDRSPEYLSRMAAKRTRVVLTSGGLEPVIDSGGNRHSIFANEFLKVLRGNEGVMDGTQVFEHVRRKVVLNADQTPEYSDIRFAGHEGGDFLFVRTD